MAMWWQKLAEKVKADEKKTFDGVDGDKDASAPLAMESDGGVKATHIGAGAGVGEGAGAGSGTGTGVRHRKHHE
jgi:hypothetical protein